MGQRSCNRHLASTPIYRLPLRWFRTAPVLVGLSLLLSTGCDRTAWEEAFAPDPQLIDQTEADADGAKTASDQGQSTAPGGSAKINSPRTSTSSGAQPNEKRHNSTAANQDDPPQLGAGDRSVDGSVADGSVDDASSSSNSNSNLADVPTELERSVADVLALGVLEPEDPASDWTFEPNQPVTRGEFARWLLAVNNAVYGDRPAAQIRSAAKNSEPVFKDVSTTHSDFAAIQGLAEAGIILSSLSGAQEQINFRPDEPLSREDMLLWKVPLDVREALPSSNLEAVKEAWGFQDASKISGPALRAVLADYGNGDQAVIRRVFGYTTLLQPQKPVSQAEAAAALGYFGNSGQGIRAGDL